MAMSCAAMATFSPLHYSTNRRASLPLVQSPTSHSTLRKPAHLHLRASVATKPSKSPAEEDWKVKRDFLLKNQVRSVNAKEAQRLVKEDDFVILDVRPEGDFKEIHPEGAVNVQVYRLIKEWTAWDIARRAAFAFFGIFQGTEENPEFLNEVRSKLEKDKRIIVACAAGGTMRPSANLAEGQQSSEPGDNVLSRVFRRKISFAFGGVWQRFPSSMPSVPTSMLCFARSLIAAYLLKLDGYRSVVHLDGGLRSWFNEELPTSSSESS